MGGVVVRQRIEAAQRNFRMHIRTDDGETILGVPFAPRGIEYTGVARQWTEIARPADEPILASAADPLARIAFDLYLANRDDRPIEDVLAKLRELAASEARLVVDYGPSEVGLWHLTDLTIRSELRHEVTDEITRAAASLTFTEVSDYAVKVSPLTGGHSSSKPKVPPTYTVKKGDTLHSIAVKKYGDPKWWRAIADAQKPPIKQPRKDAKLKPGRVLKLPRRSAGKDSGKDGKGGKGS